MAASTTANSSSINSREDFFNKLLNQYAEAGEGMVYLLTPDNPVGDVAYVPYKWTAAQQEGWRASQEVPCELNNLPPDAQISFQSIHMPEEKDRIYEPGATEFDNESVLDIRISRKQFLQLQQLAMPGSRLWMRDVEGDHALMIPSSVFVFTEEEMTKYQEDGFKKDGSDMPTINDKSSSSFPSNDGNPPEDLDRSMKSKSVISKIGSGKEKIITRVAIKILVGFHGVHQYDARLLDASMIEQAAFWCLLRLLAVRWVLLSSLESGYFEQA